MPSNHQQSSRQAQAERRRQKAEALRKQQQARERRRLIVIIGGAVVTAAIIVAIVVTSQSVPTAKATPKSTPNADSSQQIVPAAVTGPTTKQGSVKKVADTSGIPGVTAWDTTGWPGDGSAHTGALEHDHVPGPVTYGILPPVGGPHNEVWMNAGVYTKPVPTERAVHNLEHGAVWITYDPDLPAAQVKALTAFVTRQSMIPEQEQSVTGQANRYVDLTPWASNDLPSKIVISAWGHQLRLTSATDPRLQKFVSTFRNNQKYTPEFGAAVDGVPVQTGGAPSTDGSKKANPAGAVG